MKNYCSKEKKSTKIAVQKKSKKNRVTTQKKGN